MLVLCTFIPGQNLRLELFAQMFCYSWAWPALRVLAEGRVASLYQDLFWSVM